MATDEVERAEEVFFRVVLPQAIQLFAGLFGADRVIDIVEQDVSERVVHGAVELVSEEIAPWLIVTDLVTGVFPDFSNEHIVLARCLDASTHIFDERVRKLICYIESPCRGSHLEPVRYYSVLSCDEFSVTFVVLVYFRKIPYSPPGLVSVRFAFVPLVPVLVVSEVDAVHSRMAEYAIEHDAYTPLTRCLAQVCKVLCGAEHRVCVQVVRSVVAVVGYRFEYRV